MFGGQLFEHVEAAPQPKERRVEILQNLTLDDSWEFNAIYESARSELGNNQPIPSTSASIASQLAEIIPSGSLSDGRGESLQTPVPLNLPSLSVVQETPAVFQEEEIPQPPLPVLEKISKQTLEKMPKMRRLPNLSLNRRTSVAPAPSKAKKVQGPGGKKMSTMIMGAGSSGDSDVEEEESAFKIVADAKRRLKKLKSRQGSSKEKISSEYAQVKRRRREIVEEISRLHQEDLKLGKKEGELQKKMEIADIEARQIEETLARFT